MGRKASSGKPSLAEIIADDGLPQARKGAYCCQYKGKQHILACGPEDHPMDPATWQLWQPSET